jgi:hypothetical protein
VCHDVVVCEVLHLAAGLIVILCNASQPAGSIASTDLSKDEHHDLLSYKQLAATQRVHRIQHLVRIKPPVPPPDPPGSSYTFPKLLSTEVR